MSNAAATMFFLMILLAGGCAMQTVTFERVDRPRIDVTNAHYVSNRQPLAPGAFIKLPVGSVQARGWLRRCLELQREGVTGRLGELSPWLEKNGNAWLAPDGIGEWGWEEVPYWLKGYGNIGYLLGDEAMIAEARTWIEAALRSQRGDGNFGPVRIFEDDGSQDFWANMIMLFCLQSYYEFTGDERVIDLMTRYSRFQMTVPAEVLLTHYWQRMRGGDNLFSIYWLYNRTGEPFLLDLAQRIHARTADWTMNGTLPNWHNVNIAQAFGEPATYWLQSRDPRHLQAAYDNFATVRRLYGQVPGGMFGSDENCRPGFDDPRQAIETCGMVEQMLSNETLLTITGDPFWAEHTEEVAFNSLPAAFTPDFRALRYLTSPNLVVSDSMSHSPGFQNGGPMLAMNPISHRCCQHNHSHGWAYMTEHLWLATPDNGACAAIYSASEAKIRVGAGEGELVRFIEETNYPFEEEIRFRLSAARPVAFPLYLRIPSWAQGATLKVNGRRAGGTLDAGGYARIERTWSEGDSVTLSLPMRLSVKRWEQNHNAASVSYGPLTFSLEIGEEYRRIEPTQAALRDAKWREDVDAERWPAFEIHPTTPWNYALVLSGDLAKDFRIERRPWPADDFPFTQQAAPIRLIAKGRRVPEWTLDQYGLCGLLQDSPVKAGEPVEEIALVPMGGARLRISAFPVAGDGPDAHAWKPPAMPRKLYEARASHCYGTDSTQAIADDLEPKDSNDHTIPRHTFWPHRGTAEWYEAHFDQPRTVDHVKVYWFDDHAINGQCRTPKSWRLLWLDSDRWTPVEGAGEYGVERDRYNEVAFKAISTRALRIEVQLRDDFSAGALEWRIGGGESSAMKTRWTAEALRTTPLPEYPRPQLRREKWTNLNGAWQYAVTSREAGEPAHWHGDIRVPFPIESHLSGVGKAVRPDEALWYRRSFESPPHSRGKRVLLNFGAVDWDATVWCNGVVLGGHRGGYDAFSFDITDALRKENPQWITVRVRDPTDEGDQPRGKQVLEPQGIFYTAVTGIWQTVWLEVVPEAHITRLMMEPIPSDRALRLRVEASAALPVEASVYDGEEMVATASGRTGQPVLIRIHNPKLWWPEAPFLYDLRVKAGRDTVRSYFAMREVSTGLDHDGFNRILLNGKPIFMFGPLDQGWWPDGLYTAPTDAALRYDVEMTRAMGFNTARKHVKVEPDRWYYWADRLGLLVWQDMPSLSARGQSHFVAPGSATDAAVSEESKAQFRAELRAMIDSLRNHPCIVVWVPFNEGWGQHDTNETLAWVKELDPTRLVDGPSGWQDRGAGDLKDMHQYPGPGMFPTISDRVSVLGEFGGLGLPVAGHLWQRDRNWGYRNLTDREQLARDFAALVADLRLLIGQGLAAAVYTQTTDVEGEVNGLMTYDRTVCKIEPERLASINAAVYEPPPTVREVVATSQRTAQTWRYTFTEPTGEWTAAEFNDASWSEGPGGFGTAGTPGAVVGTEWSGSDIWIRRTFDLGPGDAGDGALMLRIHHDEDAQVYLNGTLVASLRDYTTGYRHIALNETGRAALRPGRNSIAIHCRQTRGGQFIDAGLVRIEERR